MDLSGIHLSGGDFVQKELQAAMNKEATKQKICLITVEEMEGPTVLFTAGVDAAKACAHYLTHNYGVPAVYVHGKQDEEERKEALAAFKGGQAKVLCNCMVVAIGFDFPPTQTLIMGRPTKSLGFALQCWGRAFRPLPGDVDFRGSTAESRKAAIAASKKPYAKIVDCTPSSQDHTLVTGIDMFVTDDEVKEYVRKAAEKKPLTPEEIAALAEAQAAKIAAAKAIEEMRKNTQGRATGSVVGREIELRGGKRCVGTYFNPIKGKYAGQKLNQLPDHYVAWAAEQIRTGWIRSMFRREQERRNAERFSHR
jgi:superfamily II DNA or RNA helicase